MYVVWGQPPLPLGAMLLIQSAVLQPHNIHVRVRLKGTRPGLLIRDSAAKREGTEEIRLAAILPHRCMRRCVLPLIESASLPGPCSTS